MMIVRPFSDEEVAAIRDRYPTEGARHLAKELNRPAHGITVKALSMGLKCSVTTNRGRRGRSYTDDELALIRREWPKIARREKNAQSLITKIGNITLDQLRYQVASMGMRRSQAATVPWSEEEIELLGQWSSLCVQVIQRRLKKRGYVRSQTAIAVKRYRSNFAARGNGDLYSARELAQLLGTSPSAVNRWIRMGSLKASPRTDAKNEAGGPGDQWSIKPFDVREFLLTHTACVEIGNADKFWLVDLLATGPNQFLSVKKQDTCGHGDGGGFDEMRAGRSICS